MRKDRESSGGQVPYEAVGRTTPPQGPAQASFARRVEPPRQTSIRRLRRQSNWAAAALILGTGSASWALAQHVPATSQTAGSATAWTSTGTVSAQGNGPQLTGPVAVTSGSGVTSATGLAGVSGGAGAAQAAAAAPQVSGPVAVSSGSGVTVTRSQVVNGQTVTTVQHIAKGDD